MRKEKEQREGSDERSSWRILSVYDDREGYENRLHFWLKLEHWTLQEAAALIADVDPESIELTPDQQGFAAVRTLREPESDEDNGDDEDEEWVDLDGNSPADEPRKQEARLKSYYRKVRDTERILGGIRPRLEVATPIEWIATALNRDVHVPWHHWAERAGLVKVINANVAQTEKPLGEKERLSMLTIIAALAEMEGLDKRMAFKSAKVIQNQCIGMGFEISENTIVKYLKEAGNLIPDKTPNSKNTACVVKNT